jgi:4-oxalocrotonate tautomerase
MGMPEVYVHVIKGRTFEQKKALVQDITSAVMKHMNAPADAVVVTIIEAEADSKGKGGVMFSERGR